MASSRQQGWTTCVMLGLISLLFYASICSFFRFRRVRKLQAKYGFTNRASLASMTNAQAHYIIQQLAFWESPLLFETASRLALFRTYAIEDIAKLLVYTGEFSNQFYAPKRFEDTAILITSFVKFSPDSQYLHKAVARMNHIHSPYIKSGKITNRDLLYTMWTLMAGPVQFLERYEWRAMTDMEVAAMGTLWKYVGDLMQIDFKSELGQNQWTDGIDFVEHTTQWAIRYEDMAMKQKPEAKQLSDTLFDLLLSSYPRCVQPMVYKGVLVVLDRKMRHAFSLPEPSALSRAVVDKLTFLRKMFVRYLMPPRLVKARYLSDPDPVTGRVHNQHYLKEPWYVRVSLWARWNPEALITRAIGGQVPGDGGVAMLPEGFLYTDLGPRARAGKGIEETNEWEQVVRAKASGSACPFAMK